MYGSQRARQLPIVFAKLADHLLRTDAFFIVIFQPLVSRDIADGAQRSSTDLARPLGDRVRHREDLCRLLIEQQMIVAKVAPAYVPVKVLRLYVKRKYVGKQSTSVARDLLNRIVGEIECHCCCLIPNHCSVLLSATE